MSNGRHETDEVILLRGAEGISGHSSAPADGNVAVGDDEMSMSAHRSCFHPSSNECST